MKIGFIGSGNMASAMIGGILKNRLVNAGDIMASDKSEASCKKAADTFGILTTTDNKKTAAFADVLILAVKPNFVQEAIVDFRDSMRPETVVATLAPGKTLEWLGSVFGRKVRLVRTMPNTPALVGEGMTALCPNENVMPEDLEKVQMIFNSFSRTEIMPETMMDIVTSVSGSSPAFVFMFIEALADGAVADGMPRAQAYKFAAQAVYGSAKMVLETGKHPGELKDMVCSPGGTTIEAVRVLEEKGMRSAVIEAVKACTAKSRSL